MEPVEHMQRMTGAVGNGLQECFPHVADDEAQLCCTFFSQPVEERRKGLRRSIAPDPEQPATALVELVDERQVLVSLLPGELIHANCRDSIEIAVRFPPRDGLADRAKHHGPTGGEPPRRLLPAERLRPRCQKPSEGRRDRRLPVAPGQQLDLHTAARAVTAAWRIHKEHWDCPQRYELILALLQSIIRAALLPTARTHGSRTSPSANGNFDPMFCTTLAQPRRLVDKTRMLFDAVQDSLQLHRAGFWMCGNNHLCTMRSCLATPSDIGACGGAE